MPTLTGNNRRREQRLQELMLLRISQQFERRLSREISRAMREAATALDNGAVSPGDAIRERHDRNITRLLNSVWSRAINDMAEHMLGTRRSWAGKMERKQEDEFDADAFLRLWVATEGVTKVRRITNTTQENIRRIIEQGAREGLGQREVGKLIRDSSPSIAAARSQVIARTEVHSASQATAQRVAEDTGVEMRRVWVSSQGERTRSIADGAMFDHLGADGQTVGMNQPFVIEGIRGDEELRYPGDPQGSAGNIINCRCCVVFEVVQ